MKVVLVPGSRNEELINRIKQIKTAYPDEAWEQLQEYEETEEFFDALFYACENGEEMLQEQMEYFQYALMHEENEYFVQRMLADSTHNCNLEMLAKEVDEKRGVAAKLTMHDCKTHENHRIIFAIREHTEGWDYYLLTPECQSIEDGVIDEFYPICDLLEQQLKYWGFLFNDDEMTLLDIDEVIEKYESFRHGIGWGYLGR